MKEGESAYDPIKPLTLSVSCVFVSQRALSDATKQFNVKLMLFYVLHEFLKSFAGDQLRVVQREWFQTVDEVLHACVREMRNAEERRKPLFKVTRTLCCH